MKTVRHLGFQLVLSFGIVIGFHMQSLAKEIRAAVFSLPETLEPSQITTAASYIVVSHLVRPLTKLDKFGKLQADLAKSWFHSKDKLTWTIEIQNAKFSNGDPITASEVVETIKRQMRHNTGVHFSFSEIQSVKLIDQKKLAIELKSPRNDFIAELSKPEFGVLHKSDIVAEKNKAQFKVTSGPYYVHSEKGSTFHLKRNPHYQVDAKNGADLLLESSKGPESAKKLESGSLDFLATSQNLSHDEHEKLKNNKLLQAKKPHIAFSYWLSINPNSAIFKDESKRAYLQSLIKDFKSVETNNHSWERADQIYLPDGDGRPTAQELERVWSSVLKKSKSGKFEKGTKLRVLPLKAENPVTLSVTEYLKKYFEVEVIRYKTEEELISLIKSNQFDLKISANDFSSIDLFENLKTTFNASRPYVFLPKISPIPDLMMKASNVDDKASRSEIFKKIGLNLIEDGLVAPIAYQRMWFYAHKSLDLSAWSFLYPEISFWKLEVNEKN